MWVKVRTERGCPLRERSIARLWVPSKRALLKLLSMIARNALPAADAGNVQVQGQRPQLVFACDSGTPARAAARRCAGNRPSYNKAAHWLNWQRFPGAHGLGGEGMPPLPASLPQALSRA